MLNPKKASFVSIEEDGPANNPQTIASISIPIRTSSLILLKGEESMFLVSFHFSQKKYVPRWRSIYDETIEAISGD